MNSADDLTKLRRLFFIVVTLGLLMFSQYYIFYVSGFLRREVVKSDLPGQLHHLGAFLVFAACSALLFQYALRMRLDDKYRAAFRRSVRFFGLLIVLFIAVDIVPGMAQIRQNLRLLEEQQSLENAGRYAEIVELMDNALESPLNYRPGTRTLAGLQLTKAQALASMGKTDEARQLYESIVENYYPSTEERLARQFLEALDEP